MLVEAVVALAWGTDDAALDRYRAEAALERGDSIAVLEYVADDPSTRARRLVLRAAEQAGLDDLVSVVTPETNATPDPADALGDELARQVRDAPSAAMNTARRLLHEHSDRPDLLAPLLRTSDATLRALGESAAVRTSKRLEGLDPLGLYRARVLLRAADLPDASRDVAERIGATGDPTPIYRAEMRAGSRRVAAAILARQGKTEVPPGRLEERVAFAADLARAAWKVDPERAEAVWQGLRAQVDSPRAALEHGTILLALDRDEPAAGAALAALRQLAGPAPDDLMRRDLPRQAVALASAWELYALAKAELHASEDAGCAFWLAAQLHPTDRRRSQLTESGWEGTGTDVAGWAARHPELALAVAESGALVDPVGTAWEQLARAHEEQGEKELAFRSYALMPEPRPEDLERTWRWPGSAGRAATRVSEAWRKDQSALAERVVQMHGFTPQTLPQKASGAPVTGKPMPAWEAAPTSSAVLRGHPYVLVLWASWCGPCQTELPELDALARLLQDEGREVAMVAVSVDTEEALMKRWVVRHPLPHLTFAWAPELQGRLEVAAIPRAFVVDEGGVVAAVHDGYNPGDDAVFEAQIRTILEK